MGWLDNHTVNGSTPSAIPLQSLVEAYSGSGFSTVRSTADNVGGSKPNTAEHPGTSPNGLDSSKGLLSAMGGMASAPAAIHGAGDGRAGEPGGDGDAHQRVVPVGPDGDGVVVAPLGHRLPPGGHGQRQW